jgi:hypothetical protein
MLYKMECIPNSCERARHPHEKPAMPCPPGRWQKDCEAVDINRVQHKRLSAAMKVFDFDFSAEASSPYPKEAVLRVQPTQQGLLNTVVFWFELHLGPGISLTSGE